MSKNSEINSSEHQGLYNCIFKKKVRNSLKTFVDHGLIYPEDPQSRYMEIPPIITEDELQDFEI